MIISSRNNTQIKAIRALRSRKEREHTRLFFVEGIRAVGEAVQLGADLETVVTSPELLSSPFARSLIGELRDRGVQVLEVTAEVFRSFSVKEHPQGIGAVVRQRWQTLRDLRLRDGACWVALHEVADPGNLGSILRTSEAVGGAGVILLDDTTDPYDPSALRAATGAIFSQRLVKARFDEFAAWKRRHGYSLVGSSGGASLDYQIVSYETPVILLMGSERHGLSPQQQELCDVTVQIPMTGRTDSLNLAVATGVLLYEVFNQRRTRVSRPELDYA